MAAAPTVPSPSSPARVEQVPPRLKSGWQKYGTPVLVILLALAIVFTITHNWNSWEGGAVEQATNDAFVRGDLTPLSTKVSGLVREVKVGDYQKVHKGDLLVQLEDDDYKAQVAQAEAAVEASKAAIENNRRQRELQDSKIERAGGGNRSGQRADRCRAGRQGSSAGRRHAHARGAHPAGSPPQNKFHNTAESRERGCRRAAVRCPGCQSRCRSRRRLEPCCAAMN